MDYRISREYLDLFIKLSMKQSKEQACWKDNLVHLLFHQPDQKWLIALARTPAAFLIKFPKHCSDLIPYALSSSAVSRNLETQSPVKAAKINDTQYSLMKADQSPASVFWFQTFSARIASYSPYPGPYLGRGLSECCCESSWLLRRWERT